MKVTSTVCLPGAKSPRGTLALPSSPTVTILGVAPSMDTDAVPANGVVPSLASMVMFSALVPTVTVAVSLGSTVTVTSLVASPIATVIALSPTDNLSAGIVTVPSAATSYSAVSPAIVTFTLSTATGLPSPSVAVTLITASSPIVGSLAVTSKVKSSDALTITLASPV